MSKTKVPAIPAPTDANLRDVARAIKGVLDVREGVLGDPLDANVTFRDLSEGGVIKVTTINRGGGSGGVVVSPGTGGGEGDQYNPATDLMPPPAPTGFTATGLFASVQLQWDALPSTYVNHAYTEIWRAETNVIGNAVLIGTSDTRFYVDYLGNAVTRYYWVRYVSQANVKGPYNATEGTAATTANNPGLLIASLSNAISNGQLATSLSDRINLIDAPTTGLVTKVSQLETTYGSTASAAASAAAAASSASAAALSQANALLAQTGAETARDVAVTAKTNAETAASNASTSATNASSSATGAAGSAALATTQATNAANSANAAGGSASAAATSESNAGTFATNAGNSATAANSAKVAAESARDGAQASAAAAATSAQTATTKATEAGQSAIAAATSATNASTSASNASTSATQASASETNAAGSASSASTSATNAANSANAAGGSATAAAGSASTAATEATNAGNSASAANTSKVAAESARDAAQGHASAAATSASTANTKATEAGQSATAASTSATNAATSASNALTYRDEAATSASNAAGSASTASFQAGVASTSASNAGASASAASLSASSASTSANNASGSASSAASSLTQLYASVSAIGLIYNSSFAGGSSTGWSGFSSVTNSPYGGLPKQYAGVQTGRDVAFPSGAPVDWFACNPGEEFEVSAWVSAQLSSPRYAIGIQYERTNGNTDTWTVLAEQTAPTTAKFLKGYWVAPADARRVRFWGQIDTVGTENPWHVTDVQLRRADSRTSANTIAVQQEATARADADGALFAQYTVKIDAAGHVSGYGLASTLNNASPLSEFGVRADRFFIAPPSFVSSSAPSSGLYKGYVWRDTSVSPAVTRYWTGSNWTTTPQNLPFIVQTTPTTINGVAVPAGVYIDEAFIENGTITNAKIANAAIDNAKIAQLDAAKVTTGTLDVQRLGANSITADRIKVTSKGGLTIISDDPMFGDTTLWMVPPTVSFQSGDSTAGGKGNRYITSSSGTDQITFSARQYEIDPSKVYRLSANLFRAANSDRNMYLFVQFYTGTGAYVDSVATGWGGTLSGYTFGGLPSPAGQWVRCGDSFGPGTGRPIPSNVRTCAIGVWFNYSGGPGGTTAEQRCQDLRLDEYINAGQLVVDGSIAARHIAAGSVTADRIDSRGLSIKDLDGNVILAAGTSLDFSRINPSSGWLNSNVPTSNGNLLPNPHNFATTTTVNNGSVAAAGLTDSMGGPLASRLNLTSSPWDMYRQAHGLTPGRIYRVSIWYERETAANFCLVVNNTQDWNTGEGVVGTASGWSRLTATVTATVGTINIHFGAHYQSGLAQQSPGTVKVAFLTVEDTSAVENNRITVSSTTGAISGIGTGDGQSVANNTDSVIRAPFGGVFTTQASVVNGAIKVRLPQWFTNTMMRFSVEVYEYITGYMCTLEIGGYTYDGPSNWINVSARVIGGSNVEYPVYFGHDGSKACVWIGAHNETWSYPQVRVRDFFAGYNNVGRDLWASGWQISFDTTSLTSGTGANQYTAAVTDTFPGADWSKTARRPANLTTLSGSEAIQNSQIFISSNAIQGIGSGAGTVVANTAISVDTSTGAIVGIGAGNGESVANNVNSRIMAPSGGILTSQSSGVSGSIRIRLPARLNIDYPMVKFTVEIYEYIAGYSATLSISGHTSGTTWYNVSAQLLGGSNVEYPVYFGHDGTYFVVWIGNASETWEYPQVFVRDVLVGYTSVQASLWASNWAISLDTGGPANVSRTVLDTYPAADWSKTARRPANLTTLSGSEAIQNSQIAVSTSTGAITGIGAGDGTQVSNSAISFGTNLLYNADFSNGLDGWTYVGGNGGVAQHSSGLNLNTDWYLSPHTGAGTSVLWSRQVGSVGSPSNYYEWVGLHVPVQAGKRYAISGFTGAHRCKVAVFAYIHNAAFSVIGNTYVGNVENNAEAAGGPTLAGYKRCVGVLDMPSGAAYVVVVLRKYDTFAGQSDSYMFAGRLQVEEVGSSASTAGPWVPSGFTDRTSVRATNPITSSNITTYIEAAAIGSLDILTTGRIRSGKSTYGSGTGWLIEYNGGTPRLDIGTPDEYMRWTGSNLEIRVQTQRLERTGVQEINISGYDQQFNGATATAGFWMNSNGTTLYGNPNWYTPTTTNIGASLWVRFRLFAGSLPSGAALNTWLQLNTDRNLSISATGTSFPALNSSSGGYEISTSSSGSPIVAQGNWYLLAESYPGSSIP